MPGLNFSSEGAVGMNGRGASLVVIILVIVSTFSIVMTVIPDVARANILYVGGAGPGNYTTIQSAIDAAFPGDTVFVYNGTYVENVVVHKIINLTGEDRWTTIIDADRNGDAILVTADWVNITELTQMFTGFAVVGLAGIKLDSVQHCYIADNNPAHTNWYGISLLNSHNNTITNNTNLSDNMHGIRLFSSHYNVVTNNNATYTYGSGVALVSSDNNTVVGNRLVENDHGIDLTGAFNNTISSNTVIGNWLDGIDIGYSKNNRIVNNTITGNWGPGVDISDSDYNLIKDNVLHDNNLYAIDMWYSRNMHITNNTMTKNSIYIFGYDQEEWNTHVIDTSNTVNGRPVYFWKNITGGTIPPGAGQVILANTSNVIVENQNLSWGAAGVLLGYSSNGTIRNISSWDNWYGNNLYQSHDNTFTNITGSDSGSTFYLYYSDRNTFTNVNSSSLYQSVIRIFDSTNSTIQNCILHSSDDDGLHIVRSDGDVIANNTIISNNRWGMGLGTGNSTVTNNTLLGNGLGISIGTSSSNNRIYHNIFINNTVQASDMSSNLWDNGYPSGGNYWSDYNGTDIMNGPNQDLPGSDGIGDTPYNITGDSNQDRYPLMNVTLPDFKVPTAPINLSAIGGDGQVTLTWDPPLSDGGVSISKYRIYRGNTSGGETFLTEIGDVTGYTDSGLTNGQTYYYQVSALNAMGEGPLSNEANATTKAPPGSPGMVGAELTGFFFEDVTITWALSSDDGQGQNSVVSYELYRNMTYDPDGLGYGLLVSVPNGTTSSTDSWAGEPDMDSYFYRICAIDKFGIDSCSQTQASKFTHYMMKGLNLASFPIVPSNDTVSAVLQTVNHDRFWSYDSLNQTWISYGAAKPYSSSSFAMSNAMGMWIDVTFGSNFTVAGVVPAQTSIPLYAGWNLVGFPSFNVTYTVADLKGETGATRVEGFDPSAPPYRLRVLQDSDTLLAGEGYWIYVPSDIVWNLSNA